ncbi:MAG: DUF262 domain-containing protein [Vicinamibacterales bacterium]
MRLTPSDPDIQTIIARIRSKDIDLQPHFQRGEVWSDERKRKLIDSILRNWHVPPIHVVENAKSGILEVLDGQQRLVSIRDFAEGKIRVDGSIQPLDVGIESLDGLSYSELPPVWRRKFDQFTIRVLRVTEHTPAEPAELFFRLNQNVALTTAEQRNAFFGRARRQVRELVEEMEIAGVSRDYIGFSNSRMAYDDVVARFCVCLDNGSLLIKITAQLLADIYRSDAGFSQRVLATASEVLSFFAEARGVLKQSIRLNKATLFSWWCFIALGQRRHRGQFRLDLFAAFLEFFEAYRNRHSRSFFKIPLPDERVREDDPFLTNLMTVYSDRAASRVADPSSIVARDAVIWVFFEHFVGIHGGPRQDGQVIALARQLRAYPPGSIDDVVGNLVASGWGELR